MGLWEYIKRALGKGNDEEMVHEASYDDVASGSSNIAIGKRWPFQKLFISADGRVPPGWVVDPLGKLRCQVNTTGVFPVTEASAATIQTQGSYFNNMAKIMIPPQVTIQSTVSDTTNSMRRIGRAVITIAAGAFANQILQTVAGAYYGVVKITKIQSNQNEAAGAATLTFESPAGTPALPTTVILPALTANIFSDCLDGLIITHATLADTQNIVVDGAGFTGTQLIIQFEYWLET